ncbi:14519_t:CDS:2, partial [Acaulospora colombiana]
MRVPRCRPLAWCRSRGRVVVAGRPAHRTPQEDKGHPKKNNEELDSDIKSNPLRPGYPASQASEPIWGPCRASVRAFRSEAAGSSYKSTVPRIGIENRMALHTPSSKLPWRKIGSPLGLTHRWSVTNACLIGSEQRRSSMQWRMERFASLCLSVLVFLHHPFHLECCVGANGPVERTSPARRSDSRQLRSILPVSSVYYYSQWPLNSKYVSLEWLANGSNATVAGAVSKISVEGDEGCRGRPADVVRVCKGGLQEECGSKRREKKKEGNKQ